MERVKQGLIDFHNGKSASQCLRDAGLAELIHSQSRKRIFVAGDPDDIATRLIALVGPTSAKAIADEIRRKLGSS